MKIVAAAAILKKDKILILKRGKYETVLPSYWELPSGKKHLSESVEGCLIREVQEETGLIVQPISPIFVFEYQVSNNKKVIDYIQINYYCVVKGKHNVVISNEHEDYAWINENELNRYKISKETKSVIMKVFEIKEQLKTPRIVPIQSRYLNPKV